MINVTGACLVISLSGNKIEAMFIGTKFEYLLSTRGVRNT